MYLVQCLVSVVRQREGRRGHEHLDGLRRHITGRQVSESSVGLRHPDASPDRPHKLRDRVIDSIIVCP